MAHLWVTEAPEVWAVLPLDAEAFSLAQNPPRRVPVATAPAAGKVLVLCTQARETPSWILLADTEREVRVNGVPLQMGLRVLADRDEIRVRDVGTFFFSTECLARVESLPANKQDVFCPRCKQEIAAGTPAVKCPQCAVWHHQTEELPCWTYSATCALCPQPSGAETGFRWAPDGL